MAFGLRKSDVISMERVMNVSVQGTTILPRFDSHVLWSYGSGNPGVGDGELSGPHTADENPIDPDEIIVAE